MNKSIFSILGILLFLSCSSNGGKLFDTPIAEKTGIDFINTITETEDLNILDYLYFYNGGGVAIGDINNDNLPDIFMSGNQVKNKLYLNKGNLKFEDVSKTAGIEGKSSWNTGAVMGDINGDGLLDIYVCAVVGVNGFNGFNELYINNGDGTFSESAAKFGLDFDSYSSSAAFLDYDLDGDLDIYILNHAVHSQESFGKADLRFKRNYQTGDKLMRNDGNKFTEVSEEAGIFGGINGYGLGIAISDFNQDGFPDIYVGNDFHEDDYYYLNNGDGTFSEKLKEHFGHTTRFSMGNDVADINHDGLPDILSLDMLPEDEVVLKTSEGDDNIQTQKMRIERYGYHYQFTRNMLHLNQQNGSYSETALMSGIAATDWSWSGLFADFNQDGEQDLFVSNGIPKRPNDLDYINFVSNDQIQKKIDNTKLVDQQALELMPTGEVHNYVFKGNKNLQFEDKSNDWINGSVKQISGATALADLDNDGDLDIITNNINSPATLYINKTNEKSNYLKLKFNYSKPNSFGIGTKVFAYNDGELQFKELYTVRGFQASSEPIIHFGFNQSEQIDSLKIIWPNNTFQVLKDVKTNQNLTISQENTKEFNYASLHPKTKSLFTRIDNNLGIDFTHIEDGFIDFNREKLIPYQVSDRGPAVSIGDLNNDSKPDIFFGGSKHISSKIYIQSDSSFIKTEIPTIKKDSIKEDVVSLIADFNNDGKNDLIIGTGGANFSNKSKPLTDSFYIQNDSSFIAHSFPETFENASVMKVHDYDSDGDLDVFVGNNVVSNKFGSIPNSYILNNENGNFSIIENKELNSIGMITDAVWSDFDNDGIEDLIVVGEWMKPSFFKNNNGILNKVELIDEDLNGLWRVIEPFDIDNDGDLDYLLGNWGLNSKFKASNKYPMNMHYADFDNNGKTETIVSTEKNGNYYPLLGLNEITSQIVSVKKKFTTYKSFAGKTVEQIFDKKVLSDAKLLTINELRSGYLKNENGKFIFVPFKNELQVSPITAFLKYDFDNNGQNEVLVAGNYFGTKPFHGRLDSFSGALIKNENEILLGSDFGLDLSKKSIRSLNVLNFNSNSYLLITIHNDKAEVYQIK
ncbi:VCBS repeat-containing protein [Urechidicola croceus]|uniref:ASPIC/UnbV domain-containing protein n=1 Tax=Urechidicola croceus TaxID=1850246 RepID=A0A1D8PAI1_9FLAO|nr:VCBS repeat-containing protein [Urechidicola croceus]AOW21545.1 hypothetical protein LPB138_13040 [Urechidicola croceus]